MHDESHAGPVAAPTEPPLGHRHAVGTRRLMVCRTGAGSPTVVVLPGAGLVSLDYLTIQQRVAPLTATVLYDRAGTGWSDPVELPRSAAGVAAELHELLHAGVASPPYLLVGHSLGAIYARRYAQLFPDEVSGLLLLDPGHEDLPSYVPEEVVDLLNQTKPDPERMPELTPEQLAEARGQFARLYAEWPAAVRDALIEQNLRNWRTQLFETANFETDVYAELRASGGLPDVPLLVLTAMGTNPYWATVLSEDLMRETRQGLHRMHATFAASVPRGEHRTIEGASHQYLHIEKPDAVVQAIRDLLALTDDRST